MSVIWNICINKIHNTKSLLKTEKKLNFPLSQYKECANVLAVYCYKVRFLLDPILQW